VLVEKMKSETEKKFGLKTLFVRLGAGNRVVLYAINAKSTHKSPSKSPFLSYFYD
jgi:hypothetical protein